jgi:large subunit ribosomal protein L10
VFLVADNAVSQKSKKGREKEVKAEKKRVVEELKKDFSSHSCVGVASLENLPTKHYNSLRKKLSAQAKFKVAKTTIVKKALEGKSELKVVEGLLEGPVALVFTNSDPFKVYSEIKKGKSKAPAKPGAIAPNDIIIPAGETNLPPGPVLSELKQAGLDAKIAGGKVTIGKDAKVAEKGKPISESASKVLAKLGIEPLEVGLHLKVFCSAKDGIVYKVEVLDRDAEFYFKALGQGKGNAIALSVNSEYFVKDAMPFILAKASAHAQALKSKVG